MTKYKHFKGEIYSLICIATHSETDEQLVIYKNSEGKSFARSYDMFFENVEYNGETVPRFKEIKE